MEGNEKITNLPTVPMCTKPIRLTIVISHPIRYFAPVYRELAKEPSLYAASDIFVLLSASEPWRLVINEALVAGLPVITTDDVGAAADLVTSKETGQVYAAGDVRALTEGLDEWFSDPEKISKMANNAKSLIQHWDVAHCALGIATVALKVKEGLKK